MPERTDIARAVFEAYRTNDRALLERLFADGFSFTSPYDDAIDRKTYFERCWPERKRIAAHFLEEVVETGGRVFVLYLCHLTHGRQFRNVETFDFDNDRIRAIHVYFGAAYRDAPFENSHRPKRNDNDSPQDRNP
ncbi:nuclear transport factor 2 family protein [uncultured Nitratireductor sp.]|uniref:nuclear transport factor 2 family protein n=1 Tax=uncultured Nitratireductor sp. TaxID=520953 RepID=UPI0025E545E2|nr:nuclear transport factor 2 family protein [uncultured Nitratireductor sp.]